jgi:thiol-disulfide isomerase/thioredoxin
MPPSKEVADSLSQPSEKRPADPQQSALPPTATRTTLGSRLPWLIGLLVCLLVASYWLQPDHTRSGDGPAVGLKAPPLTLIALEGAGESPPEAGGGGPTDSVGRASAALPGPLEWTAFRFDDQRVTLVHFWGTWCSPCRQELPELADLYGELKSHPSFRFVSVTCAGFDDRSLPTLWRRTDYFYRANGIELPTYADPTTAARRRLLQMMQREGMAYPTTVVIDRGGVIRGTWIGVPPDGVRAIRTRVDQLLEGCPSAPSDAR